MQRLVVRSTKRYRELVTDLASQGSRLREVEMMRIAWRLLADKAGLVADEREMRLVALAGCFFGEGKPDAWLRGGLVVGRANWRSWDLNRTVRLHRVFEGKLVRRDADLARDGGLEPRLIGGLHGAGVPLREGVLEGKAGLGPIQEVIRVRERS